MHKKHHGHHGHHGHHHHHGGNNGMRGVESNPDRGPPMHEGQMPFDKGYMSDDEHFDPHTRYGMHERGNNYMHLKNEVVRGDDTKIERGKFTKIS